MSFKKGDKVRAIDESNAPLLVKGEVYEVLNVDEYGFVNVGSEPDGWLPSRFKLVEPLAEWEKELLAATTPSDPVSHPQHYKFSNGAEVIDISENLTSNAGQAVQYVARSSRLDGQNKGNVLEDLRKAEFFIKREIQRVQDLS